LGVLDIEVEATVYFAEDPAMPRDVLGQPDGSTVCDSAWWTMTGSFEFDVLLYDLTSTCVDRAAEKNPMVRRGYSRDHSPDCEQLVIALIVNNKGFRFSYETFDGNRANVSTMETILRMVERKYGKARRIWVFDRGIVSEENLVAIRRRGGQYPMVRRAAR
jgi:hypothetical protein